MNTDRKIATLDIGSNSSILLLVSYNKLGQIKILDEFGGITKLGEGLEQNKILTHAAMEKTIDLCEEVYKIALNEEAEKVIVTASSLLKNAINKTEFLVACHSRLNIFPQILTPSEEANYIFQGATYDYEKTDGDIIAIEIGGDIAKIAFGSKHMLVGLHNLDIGFMKLTEKFKFKNKLISNIRSPLKKHLKKTSFKVIQDIKSWLDGRKPTVICCGGTATTLASILSTHNYHDRDQINKTTCYISEAGKIARKLDKMSLKERKKILGPEHERAEFIHTGIYTIYNFLKELGVTDKFDITTNGLRTGILKAYIEKTNTLS